MSIRKPFEIKNTFYFFTITCFNWISFFEITNLYSYIYDWFRLLETMGVYITGYVIMPNHLHSIVYVSNVSKNINQILGRGKRFMAYEIVRRLKQLHEVKLLNSMSRSVSSFEKRKGKLHNVFETSFDLKELITEKFMVQKLNYIHQNPVRGKWELTKDYRIYPHSSAGFYELGIKETRFDLKHYEEIKYEKVI